MVFKKNVKGQAAIEFLMTYGWMLLVVLIVGALIFSFVDFDGLLPNQLDLTGNLRADSSLLQSSSNSKTVNVVFTYVGTKGAYINASALNLTNDLGFYCQADGTAGTITIENLDSGATPAQSDPAGATPEIANFLNGQLGVVTFKCPATANMLEGDTFEGDVFIPVTDARTKLTVLSKGRIRVKIDQ